MEIFVKFVWGKKKDFGTEILMEGKRAGKEKQTITEFEKISPVTIVTYTFFVDVLKSLLFFLLYLTKNVKKNFLFD